MSIFIAIAMDSSSGRAVRTAGKMWHKTCRTSPFFVVIAHSFLGEGLFWRIAFFRYFLNSFSSDSETKKPLRGSSALFLMQARRIFLFEWPI
jgi:hypothetical protein